MNIRQFYILITCKYAKQNDKDYAINEDNLCGKGNKRPNLWNYKISFMNVLVENLDFFVLINNVDKSLDLIYRMINQEIIHSLVSPTSSCFSFDKSISDEKVYLYVIAL